MNRRFKQLFVVLSITALCSAPTVFAMEGPAANTAAVADDAIGYPVVTAFINGDMSISITPKQFRMFMREQNANVNGSGLTPKQKRAAKKELTQLKQNFEQQRKQRLAAATAAMPAVTKRPHAGAGNANSNINRRPAQAAKGRCRGGVCRPAQATKGRCRGGVCYRGK